MKKFIISCFLIGFVTYNAQFNVLLEGPSNYKAKEAYLYTLNGSKDIISSKVICNTSNIWKFNVPSSYLGMLKIYFPETNDSFNLISENKDDHIKFTSNNGKKITDIFYLDDANSLMDDLQDKQRKKEYILPALYQIKEYYKANSDFGISMDKEINRLSSNTNANFSNYPFVKYYFTNYNRFIANSVDQKKPTQDETIDFLVKSNDMLETSSLLRPILLNYVNKEAKTNADVAIDKLLTELNIETPRGQTVLSELIDIFDAYEMNNLKNKYIKEAQNLKCTINSRLATTLKTNKDTEIGALFPNYQFNNPINSSAKSIYDVKSDKKIIIFWASTCSHCEQEIPVLLGKYNVLKSQNVQVIGISLDTENLPYQKRATSLPWINDSELKGWNSSFIDTYNLHATPTFFILDSNNKIISKPDHVSDVMEFLKLK